MLKISFGMLILTIATAALAQGPGQLKIADFENGQAWPGGRIVTEAKTGHDALLWEDLPENSTLKATGVPTDWTAYDRLSFWCHSDRANGQVITIVLNSENPANGKAWDYYSYPLKIDWQGWRQITLRRGVDLKACRQPLGWDHIQSMSFNASGWDHEPLADTRLIFDDVYLSRDAVRAKVTGKQVTTRPMVTVTQSLKLTNNTDQPLTYRLHLDTSALKAFSARTTVARIGPLKPGQSAPVAVVFTLRDRSAAPLTTEQAPLTVQPVGYSEGGIVVPTMAAVPLPERPHPRLFLTAQEIERDRQRAARCPWAKRQLDHIIAAGNSALKLDVADIPDHGGQWGHYYVCKVCGYPLKTLDAHHHQCPHCGKIYSGWPWDDVIVARIHHRFTGAIRTLGLAYAFTGDIKYAQKAREILLAYAQKYPTFKYHDIYGRAGRSGGRLYAQTLDEAVDIIGVAWGYDLVYNAPCFSADDHQQIEDHYLREVCKTIQRNDAGASNWQSWHNAGVGAVGFCLNDAELAGWAINGKSGLRFQLKHSVLPDGFWYEGTASYHYYALDALHYLVEAAHYAGIDFYHNPVYKSLYDAPLQYTFPNGVFPSINDSSPMSLGGQNRLYEVAYTRFHDPNYAWVASFGHRSSLEAFLWGVDELPAVSGPKLTSKDFTGLGAAVLRVGGGPQAAYLHLDYGPHGGGHGHFDKLTVTLWGLGRELAPDPGRVLYGSALEGGWYKQTFAHNTIAVDQRSQLPTQGKLQLFGAWPRAAVASAICDTAYPGVHLHRTVLLTPDYLVDLYSADSDTSHTYDWLWHNVGEMKPEVVTEAYPQPLGDKFGYQYMQDIRTGAGDADWSVDFKQDQGSDRLTMLGQPGTRLFFGEGMTGSPPQPCPMVIARRTGEHAYFISLVSLAATPEPWSLTALAVKLNGEPTDSAEATAVRLATGHQEDIFLYAPLPGEKEVAGLTTRARALFVSRRDGKVVAVSQVD